LEITEVIELGIGVGTRRRVRRIPRRISCGLVPSGLRLRLWARVAISIRTAASAPLTSDRGINARLPPGSRADRHRTESRRKSSATRRVSASTAAAVKRSGSRSPWATMSTICSATVKFAASAPRAASANRRASRSPWPASSQPPIACKKRRDGGSAMKPWPNGRRAVTAATALRSIVRLGSGVRG
jgi:hypothetical protein